MKECIEKKTEAEWGFRKAGYLILAMISDTCGDAFKKNMDEVIKMSAQGILDVHPRVRYEALTSLAFLLDTLAVS